MIDVVCVKVGDKYGPEYVNRLYAMVERHFTVPHVFNCLTDDTHGLDLRVVAISLNGVDLKGWWAKMLLFKMPLLDFYPVIYFDLDTVIVDNIDFMVAQLKLAMLRDFYHSDNYGSGVLIIDAAHNWIWQKFMENREYYEGLGGDQQAVESMLRANNESPDILQDLFPDKIVSYKVHCQNRIPSGAAVVCFHGMPRPHEAEASWIAEHWKE